MRFRLLALLTLVLTSAACTPVRSKLRPPYLIDGQSYTAAALDDWANERCTAASPGGLPPNKFTTDGCSAYPEGKYQDCCIKHDVSYWCGVQRRRAADQEFRRCVHEASSPANANLMWTGVRLGGGRFMPFPWRFGYGHPWPHRKKNPPTDP